MTDERLTSLSVVYVLSIVADAFSASSLRQRKASYIYDTIQYDTVKRKCVPSAQLQKYTHALDERIDEKAVTILDNMMQYYTVRYGTLSQ
jgi:hypothetical protein